MPLARSAVRFRIVALLSVLFCVACTSLSPLRAGEVKAVGYVASWLAAQTNIQTWSADFIQTRTLKALSQPITGTGRVWFVAPRQFRWELGNPVQTIAVRDEDQMLVVYPNLKRAERYLLSGDGTGPWKDALALLETGFPRSRAQLDSQFSIISQTHTNNSVELTLEPKSAGARKLMPLVKIAFSANDFSLTGTELRFADGSTLRNDFSSAKQNPEISPNLFKPDLEGYQVTEPLRK